MPEIGYERAMKQVFKNIRRCAEFVIIYIPYCFLRVMPWPVMRGTAWLLGAGIWLIPAARRLVRCNIHAALPELPEKEVKRITRACFDSVLWNLTEYIWMNGSRKRIERCCIPEEGAVEGLRYYRETGTRIIYVTPHFGSWEASGLMSPYFGGVKIAAIARPLRNPYLNRLLNSGNREKTPGLRIIFSKGAIRAAVHALKEGWGIGTLIDQNTRVRDGGIFVDFFGLPVPTSTAPAVLHEYCAKKGIPSEILFGFAYRNAEGRVVGGYRHLSKPYEAYENQAEVIRELMTISEEFIRKYPEQYLWMYRRFQYIPENVSPEARRRFPAYATVPKPSFYRRATVALREPGKDGKTQ